MGLAKPSFYTLQTAMLRKRMPFDMAKNKTRKKVLRRKRLRCFVKRNDVMKTLGEQCG